MYRTIIIDDEEMGRMALREKLSSYCPEVEIIGEAENGKTGLDLIRNLKPDLVFLDIEMPVMNGFEMLEQIKDYDFQLIFVTAYDQYAMKAIKFSAFDYLLKPVDIEELKQAVTRLDKKDLENTSRKAEVLKENYKSPNAFGKIAIPTMEGYLFVKTNSVVHLEAERNYTMVYLENNTKQITSRTLKDFEEMLPEDLFFRCHHSHIVNLKFIDRYIKGEGGQIILENGKSITVSRRKKEDFLKRIKLL